MNCKVPYEQFVRALGNVSRIISSHAQLPITSCVRVVALDGKLTLTATNMESFCTQVVRGKIVEEGEFCVPAKLFMECIQSFPQDVLTITHDQSTINVSSSGYEAELPTMNALEFPPVPTISSEGKILEKDALLSSLSLVLFSTASDEGRPLLTGVKIRMSESDGMFATTDGYRLSVKKTPLTSHSPLDIVIPARVLQEVSRVAQEDKEVKQVILAVSDDGQLGITAGDVMYVMRRINGEYPEFEKIIPKTFSTRIHFMTKDLLKAVKSAAVFARDNANIVRLSFSGTSAILTANTPNIGKNKIEISIEHEGDDAEIAYNARFLIDFLNHVPSETVTFEMTGALNPGIFRIPEEPGYLHVIMPVRVQN
jgi:DNA polymerase-3 subunit beta